MTAETYRSQVDPAATNNPHSYALQMVGTAGRVLEVGCAVGHVTEHLAAAGNRVIGVEIDPVAAAEAEAFAERVHVADIDATPLSTLEHEPFDAIVLGDVLEHLRDPVASLRDAVSLLAPDGVVVISIPNVAHIDVRLMLLEGRWDYREDGLLDATHLRWFTKTSLRSLLHDAGLAAVRLERVQIGVNGTNLEFGSTNERSDVVRFIEADPESSTLQFVVAAQRIGVATPPDALWGDDTVDWPSLAHSDETEAVRAHASALQLQNDALLEQHEALQQQNDALRNEVAAWQRSTLVRVTSPLRSLWVRARRIISR